MMVLLLAARCPLSLYAAVEASGDPCCAAPFILIASASASGAGPLPRVLLPGTEAWPAALFDESGGQRLAGGGGGDAGGSGAGGVGTALQNSMPRGDADACMLRIALGESGPVSAAATRVRRTPSSLPMLLALMLERQMPVFSTGGRELADTADSRNATTGEIAVAAMVPLFSGRRVVGALWIAGRHGTTPAVAAESIRNSASDFSHRLPPQRLPVGVSVTAISTGGSNGSGIGIGSATHAAFTSRANSSFIPSGGCGMPSRPQPPPPGACCYSLLTSPMALQQLSMSASLLLLGSDDAAALRAMSSFFAALAGAASVTDLVGALTEALAAHVQKRFLLEARVVAAYVPEPSSAVGMLFSIEGGGRCGSGATVPAHGAHGSGEAAGAAAAAVGGGRSMAGAAGDGANLPSEGSRAPTSAWVLAAPHVADLSTAAAEGHAAASHGDGASGLLAGAAAAVAAAASRVAQGSKGRLAAARMQNEANARRVLDGATAAANGCCNSGGNQHGAKAAARHTPAANADVHSCRMGHLLGAYGGGASTRGSAAGGGRGDISRRLLLSRDSVGSRACPPEAQVVALSDCDAATLGATAAAAAGGGGVATLRAKPFPLRSTLLRQLVRKLPTAPLSGSFGVGAAKGAALEVPDCGAHMYDPRLPSRDILMLLTALSAAGGGGGTASSSKGTAASRSLGRAASSVQELGAMNGSCGGAASKALFTPSPRAAADGVTAADNPLPAAEPSRPLAAAGVVLPVASTAESGAAAGGAGGNRGLRSLLLLALPSGDGRGGTFAFYVALPQQLPAPLLSEVSQALLEILECAAPLVAHKVSRELSTDMRMLTSATPAGAYAIVHDLRTADGAGGTASGDGDGEDPAHAIAHAADMLLGNGGGAGGAGVFTAPSNVFASAAMGLRALSSAVRSVGGAGGGSFKLRSGAGGLATAAATSDGSLGNRTFAPLFASPADPTTSCFLYDTAPAAPGSGARGARGAGSVLRGCGGSSAAAFAAAMSGIPRGGGGVSRAASAAVGRFTLDDVARMAAGSNDGAGAGRRGGGDGCGSATGDEAADTCSGLQNFLSLNNTQSGMRGTAGLTGNLDPTSLLLGSLGLQQHGGGGTAGGHGTGSTARHSMSLIHIEELDAVKGTMRAQMPLLVASLQNSISNARSEAAMAQAAAAAAASSTTSAISRSSSFTRGSIPGPAQSAAAAMMAGFGGSGLGGAGYSRMSDRAAQQAPLATAAPQQLLQQRAAQAALMQGDLDQLELCKQLGVGGCAVVFKGRLGTLDCAVKLMEMPDVDGELATPATDATGTGSIGGAGTKGAGAIGKPPTEQGGPATAAAAADATTQAASSDGKLQAAEAAAAAAAGLTERRALLRNAMELAVMTTMSHPTIMQVYNIFSNVTISRHLAADGARHLSLSPAAAVELGPDAPPVCVAIVCEWCDKACLATALSNRTFPVALGRRAPTPQNLRGPRILDYKGIMMTLLDVAMALRHVHANNLIHRDVKPANILLKTNTLDSRGFTAKLGDFGFCTLLNMAGDDLSGGEPYVVVEEACGTVTHMAPECWNKPCRLDASCDIYSFGIMMYDLLAGGGRPYPEVEPRDIRRLVCSAGMRPQFEDHVPAPYRQLAQRCWSGDPRQRPRAAELVATISQLLTTIGGR
ncbi:hypothetical protein HYH02_000466 [Chlamydomonas schloesseri]|uniref:Protein kinase domain-containing protein n=1 Tax=Chlamydomonas schloesseri TaxID=2026947 RepID=A0A836BDF9_9CHLO|nr:hypothetical protein HYH02_000466 [Chlamydomonas schloesseri]|eukprot:KAG2454625.1 hypothetical protein HYH02_000466 [Chlamydomonas schloesseri]